MGKKNNPYPFDRTAFEAQTFEEADNHYGYWENKSFKERLNAGAYLSMQMYGEDQHTPLDKTIFDKRRHKNG